MGKFALPGISTSKSTGNKRVASSSAIGKAAKIPKANELTIEPGPRPQQVPQRLPATAPVEVAIYKVTDQAGDLWSQYEDTAAALWQVQVKHDARPSVVFDMHGSFNDFLATANAEEKSIPSSMQELQRVAGIKLVLTDAQDPEMVGFVHWRAAFYVAGDPTENPVRNFLNLLDGYFKHKAEKAARKQPFEVHVTPHINVCLDNVTDGFEYEHYSVNEPTRNMPMSIFEAQPVTGKRVVTMNVESDSGEILSCIIAGNTWAFRSRLDAHGVPGTFHVEDSQVESRSYYRLLRDVNVSEEAGKQQILDMLGAAVFKGLAMRVILNVPPEADTHVAEFVQELKELPQLHFV